MKISSDKNVVQMELVLKYFKDNPNKNIKHPEIVDWVTAEFKRKTGKVFRDPDRAIRSLAQKGILIKVSKGVYRYEPGKEHIRDLEDFTPQQKETVLKRDGYKCVICGKGREEGMELHVDHIKPKDLDGKPTIENGQTLCSQHNFLKKNFKQTETGKKMFIRLYELAKNENNLELIKFCEEILDTYERNNINCHIKWEK